MKLTLLRQTKTRDKNIIPLLENYHRRIRSWADLQVVEQKKSTAVSPQVGEYLIAVDERGKQHTSEEFAELLRRLRDDPGVTRVSFVVGDSYGIDQKTRLAANESWALSKMVLPGDLAWLFVSEQLYRGLSILAGSPYHHS